MYLGLPEPLFCLFLFAYLDCLRVKQFEFNLKRKNGKKEKCKVNVVNRHFLKDSMSVANTDLILTHLGACKELFSKNL